MCLQGLVLGRVAERWAFDLLVGASGQSGTYAIIFIGATQLMPLDLSSLRKSHVHSWFAGEFKEAVPCLVSEDTLFPTAYPELNSTQKKACGTA